jgi:hypothetical protein
MKFLFLLALTLSSAAFAGDKYICTEIGGEEYAPKKLVLTQIGNAKYEELKRFPYTLEIYASGKRLLLETVNVKTEDVMVSITNSAKRISGTIYLDEMEASYLTIGSKKFKFDCN